MLRSFLGAEHQHDNHPATISQCQMLNDPIPSYFLLALSEFSRRLAL